MSEMDSDQIAALQTLLAAVRTYVDAVSQQPSTDVLSGSLGEMRRRQMDAIEDRSRQALHGLARAAVDVVDVLPLWASVASSSPARCLLCDGFRYLPNRMNAPGGPICGCGQPSVHEDGSCGVEHEPVPCPACTAPPNGLQPIVLHVNENEDPEISCLFCGGTRDHVPRPYAVRYLTWNGSAVIGLHKDCYERARITQAPAPDATLGTGEVT